MAQKFSSTGLTGLSGSSVSSPFGAALQTKINPAPLPKLNSGVNTGLIGLGGQSVVSPFQGSTGTKPPTQGLQAPDPAEYKQANLNGAITKDENNLYPSGVIGNQGGLGVNPYTPNTQSQYNIDSQGGYRKVEAPATPTNSFIGALGGLSSIGAGSGMSAPSIKTAQTGLQDIATNQTKAVTDAQSDYNKFAQSSPYMIAAQSNPSVAADVASGRSSLLGSTFGAILGAKQQAVGNALSGQGQQISAGTSAGGLGTTMQGQEISALQNAGSLAQPQSGAAFFGSPETGNVVGTGGTEGQTGNNLIDSAVQNAISMIRSGSSTSDAMSTLGQLGAPAQQALISAMRKYDPNWNITSSNAIAQQNMTQGMEYQKQATQLATTLKQLDTLEPTINDFLNRSGLNKEENPFFNQAINAYKSQLENPADVKSLNAMMADVKTYTAQILGNSGLNPTEVSATVNSLDPSLLTGEQLKSFLGNLRNLGQIRLQPLQQTAQASYGGSSGYMGSQATPSGISSSATRNTPAPGVTTEDPGMQAVLGGIGMAAGSATGLVSGLAKLILR